jgi:glutaminyl-tRNA synthetase
MVSEDREKASESAPEPTRRSNFVRDIIDRDLETGKYGGRVLTRFPPEPNGYLHIGHAKAICLNFGIGRDYNTSCNLRFDDTNPLKEDVEYEKSIQEDVRWLGFDWPGEALHASDYFEQLYDYAQKLVMAGKAYVDSSTQEEIREARGSLTEAGTHSPYRDRTAEENLHLFRGMRAGEFEDGTHVLRAKINMSSPNMLMRDPLLYRIRHVTHHRTGDNWCIYPMYDYAHCIEDAIENITHSICTLEFENNRELYEWVLQNIEHENQPQQIEFARLSLGYTVMSKRKLLQLVEEDFVSGWDDPRMPTIAGLKRRGVTPESIRAFCDMIGVAKANSTVDIDKLEYCVRNDLNHKVRRVLCVVRPLKVVITNYPEGQVEWLDASYYPHDVPLEGSRKLPFGRELYIDESDFMEEPEKKWFRLAPGKEVRLRYAYIIRCDEVIKDPNTGEIQELRCTYEPDTRGGNVTGRKVKGTLHWVEATQSVPCDVRLYDRLFSVEKPDGNPDVDFKDYLNPGSLVTEAGARVEPSVLHDPAGTQYQFERTGYFCSDSVESSAEGLIFNRIVTLRDSWAKMSKSSEPAKEAKDAPTLPARSKKRDKPSGRSKVDERNNARAASSELQGRFDRYQSEWGLSADNADRLTGDLGISSFFESAVQSHDNPGLVARWVVNEILRVLKDTTVEELRCSGVALGQLVRLVDEGEVSNAAAKEVFEVLITDGGDPGEIVERLGVRQVKDVGAIEAVVDAVLVEQAENVARYRAGEQQLMGMFIGAAMRASGGAADPKLVRELLLKKLS